MLRSALNYMDKKVKKLSSKLYFVRNKGSSKKQSLKKLQGFFKTWTSDLHIYSVILYQLGYEAT